ncbi:MAG: alcohol dehydrogenase catalytic domain-containing protein [Thaumarchaeota archaeon]|nr:alcohol dehydrogenase catalytic domain-containing protein [Nitrososphaerota archaeon]
MRAAFVGEGRVDVREADMPEAQTGGIVVRMRACGICGSDLEKVYGMYAKPSMRLGHEPAGTVAAVGDGAGEIRAGDRVFTHHHVSCGSCRHCARGEETLCASYSSTNLSPCGLAEHYAVPAQNVSRGGVLRLPDGVTFEQAAMIEPLACCLRAWDALACREGDTVAVLGCGPTGIMHSMIARSRGIAAICTDTNEYRVGFARDLGATEAVRPELGVDCVRGATGGRGADVAIVATGSARAIADGVRMARDGGTVMLFGVPPRGAALELDAGDLYARGVGIRSSYAASDADTRRALEMIAGGRIDVARLVTHRYRLADSNEAFERARGGESAMKVLITE